MANQLKMATVHSILTLRSRGWSYRRIARELGVHRETVARYVEQAAANASGAEGDASAKPANAPTGSNDPQSANAPTGLAADEVARGGLAKADNAPTGSGDPKPATAPPGSDVRVAAGAGPPSACAAFREVIEANLDAGLSAQRIYQDLTIEHGFAGSYYSVRRFVRRLGQSRPLPFRRMECAPGEEAQIDFGTGAPVIIADDEARRPGVKPRRRKTHVLRIVLSHSRKGYSEAVYRQTADDFIRCLENAFHHFGGVPRTLVVDNLKAAVIKADWYDPDINPKLQAFAEYYGTVILPTKPRTPRHKGKVERGVGYVQDNGLKGLTFNRLADENRHLLAWETHVADTRIHGTTRKQVEKMFSEVERPALLPLPPERFPFFHEARRIVSRDAHVEVDKAYYSVPPEHLGRRVWVRWDGRTVRVFDRRMQQIAMHVRAEPGRFRTQPQHIDPKKINGVERGAAYWLRKAGLIGPHTQQWAEAMIQHRGIEGVRVLIGLNSLTHRHPDGAVEQACAIAQTHGAYKLRAIRELIKRNGCKQEQFAFIETHPIIRSLADYGTLVRTSLTTNLYSERQNA